ncbi:hypothetical protein E2C01_091880 [Portunus trituberculatus]|uniref:Uncharacterized protein n=1 Tax=Portunus trituberculatus TaxID=210409 RepID=A0A5B7JF43_PORTR|nr:hypothetical protein [Portunus trituberculatus]
MMTSGPERSVLTLPAKSRYAATHSFVLGQNISSTVRRKAMRCGGSVLGSAEKLVWEFTT